MENLSGTEFFGGNRMLSIGYRVRDVAPYAPSLCLMQSSEAAPNCLAESCLSTWSELVFYNDSVAKFFFIFKLLFFFFNSDAIVSIFIRIHMWNPHPQVDVLGCRAFEKWLNCGGFAHSHECESCMYKRGQTEPEDCKFEPYLGNLVTETLSQKEKKGWEITQWEGSRFISQY